MWIVREIVSNPRLDEQRPAPCPHGAEARARPPVRLDGVYAITAWRPRSKVAERAASHSPESPTRP
jgi:hypothetical protein